MDKNILKKFAIESRQDLMDKIRNKIRTFYIDEDFNSEQKGDIYILSNEKHSLNLTNEEFKKRELLIKRVRELSLEQVIEEAAYTWFNRIIAIRYMEINDMLPLTRDNQSLGIRVLSSKDNTPDPEILKFTNLINPELDIDFKKEKYVELNDDNEKFKYVLLLICKKLGRVIPQVFDGITDYIDILIPDNLLNDTGFITKVINEVPEDNYSKVEIIGWLYQYYNQLEKDRVISSRNAYKKNEIVYATQLFTPDWIVKYMVENSLGRYWIENSNHDYNEYNWKYLISKNIKKQNKNIGPNKLTFIDPCCGSGHILVYAFEVLYQIYSSCGYNKNDISEEILKNNIFGLDIDDRAGQLSILSLLLKAREYDKNIFRKEVLGNLNILSIQETHNLNNTIIEQIDNEKAKEEAYVLKNQFLNGKEFGSLINPMKSDFSNLEKFLNGDNTIFGMELKEKFIPLIKQNKILYNKYKIIITNPPYLNNSVMSDDLKKYLLKNYSLSKTDLFTCFIDRCNNWIEPDGYSCLVTMQSWMFLPSFSEFRKMIIENFDISTLLYMDNNVMGIAFGTVATVFKNRIDNKYCSGYYCEVKYQDIKNDYPLNFPIENNRNNYSTLQKFLQLPNYNFSYWLDDRTVKLFTGENISNYAEAKQGLATGCNDIFMRFWYEVNNCKVNYHAQNIDEALESRKKWFPYNKGGACIKWYGNNDYIVNWENDGYEIKHFTDVKGKLRSRPQNMNYYFKKSITWSLTNSVRFGVRFKDNGNIFDINGMSLFIKNEEYQNYFMGFLNSNTAFMLLKTINPTMANQSGDILKLPIIIADNKIEMINELVLSNIKIAKDDWNSFETSWDFTKHPLLKPMSKVSTIRDSLANLNTYTYQQRSLLKHNEEELNKIFIDIYGLNDKLTPEVNDKDITIRIADKERDIKSLISYAVGCMFGRYSLDKDGLIYAGGDFDNVYQKYKKADGGWAGSSLSNYKYLNDNGNEIELSFEVDNDNIIPITDEAYFSDDIVERFKKFIKTVYGDNTFNDNMDFIAETLGKKGTETSEETIRRYFVNDFFNDHVKMYQKRPIYWLLDSGKKNGFKALIYMHRYNENLIPKARLDYLHRVQTTYEKLLSDINYKLTTDLSMTDKKEAKNRQADLNAKLQEIKEYDEKIAHIANQRISIDLDDGVKVNYDKFKDILAKIK